MAITLDREAYEEFRCFGLPDEYPKDIPPAVTDLLIYRCVTKSW